MTWYLKGLLGGLLLLGLTGCQCRRYLQQYTTADQRSDVVAWGKGGLIDACPGPAIHIGFPTAEQGQTTTHPLALPSTAVGPTAWLFTRRAADSSYQVLHQGDRVALGGCTLEVLRILAAPAEDGQRPTVYVRLLELPKGCGGCNRQLDAALARPISVDAAIARRRS